RDLRPGVGTVPVLRPADDEERPTREQAEHARAVELVENARDHLVPELAAHALVHGRLAEVLRRDLVSRLDGVGPSLPGVVAEAPLEALHADRRDADEDSFVD